MPILFQRNISKRADDAASKIAPAGFEISRAALV
jgi:hypothetical protein